VTAGWERLGPGVFRRRLPFLDVTVGVVVGSTGTLLVDAGTTLTEAREIRHGIAALTSRPVTHVLLTHAHFDHVLGSSAFPGAAIYAAPQVAAAMSAGAGHLRADAIRYGASAAEVDRAIAALRQPDQQIRDAAVDLGDRVVRISHPGPGHTDHDLIAVVAGGAGGAGDRNIVFCGDLVEESADPAIGTDSDVAGWVATLDRVLEAGGDDAVFVPGHGAAVGAAFVRGQQRWLRERL